MAGRAPLRISGSAAGRGLVVHLDRDIARTTTRYIHPLDRVQELRGTGWEMDGLIREMRMAGYIVTKHIVKAWVKNGLLPPPRK
jgi:hypothetical protein